MSKRLSPMILKTKHWGIGFDFEIMPYITVIDLMFANRTLRIRLRTKLQQIEQDKRMKAFEEMRTLSKEIGETE